MVLKEENTVKGNKHCIRFFTDLLIVIIHSTNKRENPHIKMEVAHMHLIIYIFLHMHIYKCAHIQILF